MVTFSPICPADTVEAGGVQLVMQLGMDQMNLAKIGLAWVACHPRPVLDRFAHVGIALNPQTGEKPNALLGRLAEPVPSIAAHCRYHPHGLVSSLRCQTLIRELQPPGAD